MYGVFKASGGGTVRLEATFDTEAEAIEYFNAVSDGKGQLVDENMFVWYLYIEEVR